MTFLKPETSSIAYTKSIQSAQHVEIDQSLSSEEEQHQNETQSVHFVTVLSNIQDFKSYSSRYIEDRDLYMEIYEKIGALEDIFHFAKC
jgi:hypothetical protein